MLANIMERNRTPISEDILGNLFSGGSVPRNKSTSRRQPLPGHAKSDICCDKVGTVADIVVDNASVGDQNDKMATQTTNRLIVPATASAVINAGIKVQKLSISGNKIEIPASKFLSTTRTDGRPVRNCFPVLQHWRNERMVYERPPKSALPVIAAVEFIASDTRSAPIKRRRGRLAGCFRTQETIESGALPPKAVRARRHVKSEILSVQDHCDLFSDRKDTGMITSKLPVQPLRSALKRSADRGEFQESDQHKRKHDGGGNCIRFAEEPTTKRIKNFTSEDLWYPGFMVDCDGCEQPVQWGAEGIMTGSPGRSRFTQWQVLCNSCLTKKIYAELGVWFIIALAAGKGVGKHIASHPVSALLNSLQRVSPTGTSDQLVEFLGKEAEEPEVRNAVLQNAFSHVSGFLGRHNILELKEDGASTNGNGTSKVDGSPLTPL